MTSSASACANDALGALLDPSLDTVSEIVTCRVGSSRDLWETRCAHASAAGGARRAVCVGFERVVDRDPWAESMGLIAPGYAQRAARKSHEHAHCACCSVGARWCEPT